MPRSLIPSMLILLLGLVPGCRPSKAEFDAMQAQLSQIQAQQTQLGERVGHVERDDSPQTSKEQFEHDRMFEGLVDMAQRLTRLEETITELQKKPTPRPAAGRPNPKTTYKVELGDAPIKGSTKALVTIVMWTDYQCPYCARVQTTLHSLEEQYGKDLRFVHKNNPLGFHPRAMPAALAAGAANRQGKFWKMNDRLFDNQKELTDKNFAKWAKKIGLKVSRFKKDMADPKLEAAIKAEQAEGMRLGARGTPAFFVNGRFLSGAQPLEAFRKLIDEEMAEAKALVKNGTRRQDVYSVVIADGKTEV